MRLTSVPRLLRHAGLCLPLLLCPRAAPAQTPAPDPQKPPELSAEPQDPLAEATALTRRVPELDAQGKYDEAISLAERALALRVEGLGPDAFLVAQTLSQLSILYQKKAEWDKAERALNRAMKICGETFGREHPFFANLLNQRGGLLYNKGDYAAGEESYLEALALFEKLSGADSTSAALVHDNLGGLYQNKGDFKKAEKHLTAAFEIRRQKLGEEHRDVALSLHNLGTFYQAAGDLLRAEQSLKRALELRKKVLGDGHPDTAPTLVNLATLYKDKGDHRQAADLMIRALEIFKSVFGDGHPNVAVALNNIATLYESAGEFKRAEELMLQAREIYRRVYGEEHPAYAAALNNLATLYRNEGFTEKARAALERAQAIYEKAVGPEHPDTALALGNLALLAQDRGDYGEAESKLLKALAVREKTLGEAHPDVALTLVSLGLLHWEKGELKPAVDYLARAGRIREDNLRLVLVGGTENQKRLYAETLTGETYGAISLHALAAKDDAEAARLALSTILQRKGRTLDVMLDQTAALRRRFGAEDRSLLDRLSSARAGIAKLTLGGAGRAAPAEYRKELERLAAEAEEVEAKIGARSAEYRRLVRPVTIEAVQASIPADAALVEIYLYRPLDFRKKKVAERFGPERLAAYVLRREGAPKFVDLGEAAPVNEAADRLGAALANPRSADVSARARALYDKVLRPVRAQLGDAKLLLLSPDGALNLVPFGALVDENGRYLVESYTLTYLTSGRDLLRMEARAQSPGRPAVFANPAFDLAAAGGKQPAQQAARPRARGVTNLSETRWPALEGTAGEAEDLKKLLPEARVFTGGAATEGELKRVSAPRILHVATHGFFLPDEPPQPVAGTRGGQPLASIPAVEGGANPLLRSGLVLAGANDRRSGEEEDGLLTALEASGLDLWGTKLVVLSACETGVGVTRSGDGVYGLRRALILAGAESELMTLWRVDDRATRELMADYYRNIQQGEGRAAALRKVQLAALRRPTRKHPFYWAPFIMVGDWRPLDAPDPAARVASAGDNHVKF